MLVMKISDIQWWWYGQFSSSPTSDFDNIFPDCDSTHEIAHDYHQFMMTIVITNDDVVALVNDINLKQFNTCRWF